MPTPQEVKSIERLGIIAGGGMLPQMLVEECHRRKITPFLIGFEGHTDHALMNQCAHQWASFGAAGLIINSFKAQGIKDIIMIGAINRPSFSNLKADLKGLKILARIGLRALGDSSLLLLLKQELEHEGFTLHGVHEFCEELLPVAGALSRRIPDDMQWQDIMIGARASQELGKLDLGQSAVIENGKILGVEGRDGTDALIRHAGTLKNTFGVPILVKTCKPQQDKRLDLPTIGPHTVQNAHEAGFAGIAVQAGATLIVDRKVVEDMANAYNMFVVAFSLNENK